MVRPVGSISLKTHRTDLTKELARFQKTGPELSGSCLGKLRAARDTVWATAGPQIHAGQVYQPQHHSDSEKE